MFYNKINVNVVVCYPPIKDHLGNCKALSESQGIEGKCKKGKRRSFNFDKDISTECDFRQNLLCR